MKSRKIFLVSLLIFCIFLTAFGCQWIPSLNFPDEPPQGAIDTFENSTVDGQKIYDLYTCVAPLAPYERGRVIKVVDGDSIVVRMGGRDFEVRYIGVDAPEFNSEEREAAIQAARANESMLIGQEVVLIRDVSQTDKYGRLLRYVFTEDHFVNLEMVAGGFAEPKAYPPDTACQQLLDLAD